MGEEGNNDIFLQWFQTSKEYGNEKGIIEMTVIK